VTIRVTRSCLLRKFQARVEVSGSNEHALRQGVSYLCGKFINTVPRPFLFILHIWNEYCRRRHSFQKYSKHFSFYFCSTSRISSASDGCMLWALCTRVPARKEKSPNSWPAYLRVSGHFR